MSPGARLWPLLVVAAAGCSSGPRVIQLELGFQSSCGSSSRTYDISCIAALEIRLVSSTTGEIVESKCTPISGLYASINEMITAIELLAVLETKAYTDVQVEMRGFHSFNKPACSELTDGELMLWGKSGTVDLSSRSLDKVRVVFECRAGCDCAALDASPTVCPAQLIPGICGPGVNQLCRGACDKAADCFGGELSCAQQVCTPLPSGDGMCRDCATSNECPAGHCVRNTTTNEHFCARACPPLAGADPCPAEMACRQVHGSSPKFEVLP